MKVSVLMITYNHAQYLAQAIESALNQETAFDYEIVIGEDFSTDGTRELAAKYADAYPQKIRLLQALQNQGMHENFLRTWKACSGEYIAVLEGDDFWTSRTKLQRQADFLDANPECSLCFHKATLWHADGSKSEFPEGLKSRSGVEDILRHNFIPTPSTMLRRGLVHELPPWVRELAMGDWPLWTLHAACGQLGFINDTMATYREHAGGAWSPLSRIVQLENSIPFLRHIDREFGFRYHRQVSESIFDLYSDLSRYCWEGRQYSKARQYAWASFREIRFSARVKEKVMLLARMPWPAGFRLARSAWRLTTKTVIRLG